MVALRMATRTEVTIFAADFEALWRSSDELFATMSAKDWAKPHGKRWLFADLPYHLAYFDRECLRVAIEGLAATPDDRLLMPSEERIDAWNARMFAARPAGQPVKTSLAQMRASRESIRQLLAGLADDDLDGIVWSPFFGWTRLRDGLTGILGHAFNYFREARLRLGRTELAAPPAVTHRALGFYVGLMERFLDRERAGSRRFTAVLTFTGPGGGSWTIAVTNGVCHVTEGAITRADLTITQSPEKFVAVSARVKHPMLLMLTGQLKVKGFGTLATFGKLFPSPTADPHREWPVTLDLEAVPA